VKHQKFFRCRQMMHIICLTGLGLVALFLGSVKAESDGLKVYAEGAYDYNDLVLYVYADVAPTTLVSMGIKVTYDASKLTFSSAQKNEDIWYFGTPTTQFPYIDPKNICSSVVIMGGKLDTHNPTEGVTGNRILLGIVSFTRAESGDPGSSPQSYFGVNIELGKDGEYANFVDTDGNELDENITFSTVIHEKGDANGDGRITSADMFKVRRLIGRDYSVFADCNGDGHVTKDDMFCIKNKI